jgi:hypothetical protein
VLLMAAIGVGSGARIVGGRRTVLMYVATAALAVWASFGPAGGLYTLIVTVVPGMSFLRVPARVAVVDVFALCVLAGAGIARLQHRREWLSSVVLVALVAELWVPWPLERLPPVPRAYRVLAGLPRGAVVELPFQYDPQSLHQHAKAMMMSTFHWQPLVNGYSDFIPPDFLAIAAPLNQFLDQQAFDIMRARQVRYIVVRINDYGPYSASLLARLPAYEPHLQLIADDQGVRLYQITSWPTAGSRQ